MSEPEGGAHNITRLDDLLSSIRTLLDEWTDEHGHSYTITKAYVNGSYGAQVAHHESDIDITIGVTGMDLSACSDATQHLQQNLGLHDGWWKVDPCVLPVGPVLYGHIEERSEHAAKEGADREPYKTVYDVLTGEYVRVSSLR